MKLMLVRTKFQVSEITEAKSATIRRIQNNLEDWNKQLEEIVEKKERDGRQYNSYLSDHLILLLDTIVQSEVEKRDAEIEDLKKKYSVEMKLRMKVEKKCDNMAKQLVSSYIYTIKMYCQLHGLHNKQKITEEELDQHKQQVIILLQLHVLLGS